MKLVVGDYEVQVVARWVGHERANINDTQSFMNLISSECYNSCDKYREDGHDVLAEESRKMASDIYKILDSQGIYDDVSRKEKERA